jgi:hypothetical protein
MRSFANVQAARFTSAALAMMLVVAGTASAETLYTAVLDGQQEVPEVATPAIGLATIVLNDAQTMATYHIEYNGLLGTETAAHFHIAPSGTNGAAVFALPAGSPKDGVWPVGPAEVTALNTAQVYVNIHTDQFPGGEIRGNFCFAAVETENATWGGIKTLYRR